MRYRVLLIDDEWTIARGLSARLRTMGWEVRTAPDGVGGLDAARESPPDCILLDLHLPDIDGFEVLRRLRGTGGLGRTPVICLTAYSECRVRAEAERLGAVGIFTKPYDYQSVIHAVEDAIETASLQELAT
jgi:two-component system OmpR family response regulator